MLVLIVFCWATAFLPDFFLHSEAKFALAVLHPDLLDRPQVLTGKFLDVLNPQPAFLLSIHNLEKALGQYVLYFDVLVELQPERLLLALPVWAYTRTVFDRSQDRYLVLALGWEDPRYEHGCMVHIDIIGDKIWIQRDGPETGIALDLEHAGIPKEHIVLGFKPPEIRPLTGYGVA